MSCTSTFFSGRRVSRGGAARPVAAARSRVCVVRAERVLIVNTKKGGHAFLGLYLAKRLLGKGYGVTIFNDGDPVCPPRSLRCRTTHHMVPSHTASPRGPGRTRSRVP